MYEFIQIIHIFFAVQNKKLQAPASCEGDAQAHLLPQPGRARLPQPLGLHAAAPIVGVARSRPDS